MKRHIKLRVLAILLTLAGAMLGAIWAVFSLAFAGQLLMNGPWLVALLTVALGAGLAFASIVSEVREQRAEDRRRSLRLAVRVGLMSVNDARREMGLPPADGGER